MTANGVAVVGPNEIAVVDTNGARVMLFDFNGKLIRQWGKYGSKGPYEFREPSPSICWEFTLLQHLVVPGVAIFCWHWPFFSPSHFVAGRSGSGLCLLLKKSVSLWINRLKRNTCAKKRN
jgi:hypothetical protein